MTADGMRLGRVQDLSPWLLMGAIGLASAALLAVGPHEIGATFRHFWTETPGYLLIVLAIGIRLWRTLHIGSRKNRRLVTGGLSRMTRNPLYVGSILGAVGVGLQTGMVTFALIAGGLTALVFVWVVGREETHPEGLFGAEYAACRARTPRFLPRLSLCRDDAPTQEFEAAALWRTLRDASVLLLAVPLTEGLEALHMIGWSPDLLTLY